jgi:RimJ/RimL family protein N-acetyltransferase
MSKAGLRREGLLRQAIRKWDNFEDVVLYAILRQDFTERGEDSHGGLTALKA